MFKTNCKKKISQILKILVMTQKIRQKKKNQIKKQKKKKMKIYCYRKLKLSYDITYKAKFEHKKKLL